jgi:cell division inhibitor SepF
MPRTAAVQATVSQEHAAMDSPFGIWIPQVTILRCHRLDDAREAVEAIRSRHCVLLQVEDAPPDEAQRIIDFLAGAVDALDGQVERIDTTTFLFTPAGVSITHT